MGSITESQTPTGDDDMVIHARRRLKLSRARQRLVLVLMAKDLADALIAIQDLVGVTLMRTSCVNSCMLHNCMLTGSGHGALHLHPTSSRICRLQNEAGITHSRGTVRFAVCICERLEVMASMSNSIHIRC